LAVVDVVMAGAADHEGLAAAFRHEFCPLRSGSVCGVVEIGQFADVMDLDGVRLLADLTFAR
jgi:hypothetical protein